MKAIKTFKLISIVSYLLIILMGEMIGISFFVWLLFTMFDFGNVNQSYALLAVVGLTINFINLNKKRTFKVLFLDFACFLLMASPIVWRMIDVNIHLFNYWTFIVPTIVFALLYLISIGLSIEQYLQERKTLV